MSCELLASSAYMFMGALGAGVYIRTTYIHMYVCVYGSLLAVMGRELLASSAYMFMGALGAGVHTYICNIRTYIRSEYAYIICIHEEHF